MSLSALSAEQQQAFYDRLKEFEMDPSAVIQHVDSSTHPGPITFSANPALSTFPPHIVTLTSVDDAKRLAGNPDEHYENGVMMEHHETLPEWPAHKTALEAHELSPEEKQLINKAHVAYIYGNSKKVQSYKDVIEKHNYPVEVAAVAIESLCLDATNSPFQVKSDAGLNIGTLTICQGGSINFEANSHVTIQVMHKSDATSCPK